MRKLDKARNKIMSVFTSESKFHQLLRIGRMLLDGIIAAKISE